MLITEMKLDLIHSIGILISEAVFLEDRSP